MVRLMRGLGIGILGFFLFLIAAFVVMGNTVGFGGEEELTMEYAFQEVPIWTILMLIGFALMILAPIYYWFIEPLLQKRKEKPKYE